MIANLRERNGGLRFFMDLEQMRIAEGLVACVVYSSTLGFRRRLASLCWKAGAIARHPVQLRDSKLGHSPERQRRCATTTEEPRAA